MINTSLPSKSIENIYWEHFSSIKVLHKVGQTSKSNVLLAKPPDMAKCYHQIFVCVYSSNKIVILLPGSGSLS